MSVNYNDRTGVLGIDLTPQDDSYQDFAFKPGSQKDQLIKNLYNIEQSSGFSNPKLDQLKQEDMQQFKDKGTPLSLPSDAYTADLRNLNDRMTDVPIRLSRNLDYDLINKVREYNPNYDRYTDQEITELGIPIFNKTMPSSMNSGVTNTNSFKNILSDQFGGIKDTMQRIYGQGKDYGRMAIDGILSAVTGIPGIGLLLRGINPNPPSKIEYDYLSQSGYSPQLKSIYGPGGIMENYNAISAFGRGPLNSIINRRNAILARKEAGKSYGKTNLEKLNQAIADLGVSEYRASRPESERNVTGPSGGGRDNTGGDIGSRGAADQFSNKSGFGRTGY
jgi:hypothetical protein